MGDKTRSEYVAITNLCCTVLHCVIIGTLLWHLVVIAGDLRLVLRAQMAILELMKAAN